KRKKPGLRSEWKTRSYASASTMWRRKLRGWLLLSKDQTRRLMRSSPQKRRAGWAVPPHPWARTSSSMTHQTAEIWPIEFARYRPTLRDWRKATIRKRVTKKLSICLRLTRLRGIPYIAVPNAWALSSAGERSLHTGEVVGSIPTAPTILVQNPCTLFAARSRQAARIPADGAAKLPSPAPQS